MARQVLVTVSDLNDANRAIDRITGTIEEGDEVIVLVISKIPEAELVGSVPPPTVVDPLATTGGVSSAPRAADDQPVFIGREELMDIQSRELSDSLAPRIAALHDEGHEARIEVMFSDDPSTVIQGYAADVNVQDICATEEFRSRLSPSLRERVRSV